MRSIVERFQSGLRCDPAAELVMRDGTLADYAALAEFHYLRSKPVTATRVLVLEDRRESVGERYREIAGRLRRPGRESDCKLRFEEWKCEHDAQGTPDAPSPGSRTRHPLPGGEGFGMPRSSRVVAVLVESYPALSCVLRDEATGNRYTGWRDRGDAARLLNAEVRCISRVVVHPQWRGVGLAVRIVKHALATATTRYTEALAAMGRVHPFFKLAGMREYQRWPLAKDQRLLDAMRFAGAEAWELASEARMRGHLERSAVLREELARWAGRRLNVSEQMERARDGLLCEPRYYIKAGEG